MGWLSRTIYWSKSAEQNQSTFFIQQPKMNIYETPKSCLLFSDWHCLLMFWIKSPFTYPCCIYSWPPIVFFSQFWKLFPFFKHIVTNSMPDLVMSSVLTWIFASPQLYSQWFWIIMRVFLWGKGYSEGIMIFRYFRKMKMIVWL